MKKIIKSISGLAIMGLVLFTSSCKKQENLQDANDASLLQKGKFGLANTQSLGGSSLTVSMGGNAYVTTLASGGAETVTSTKLANWTNANSIFRAYFRIGNT
ncbi:MAG: hypothetical protein EOP53_27205, partial [Sphingobacteriales bacterium]